jgi:hypothetical protein
MAARSVFSAGAAHRHPIGELAMAVPIHRVGWGGDFPFQLQPGSRKSNSNACLLGNR